MDFKSFCQTFRCSYVMKNNERCPLRSQNSSKYCSKHYSTYERESECPVCMGKVYKVLRPCEHWVCKDCIIKSGKPECPICRKHVTLSKKERDLLRKEAHINRKKKEEEERKELIEEYGIDEDLLLE